MSPPASAAPIRGAHLGYDSPTVGKPKRTLIISSVNPNTVKKIEEIAINCGITKAEIVRKILLDYLKNETPNDQIEEQKQ